MLNLPISEKETHPSLYFDDGDIELSAVTVDGAISQLFKVHRINLRRSSEVFRDIFTVAVDHREEIVQMHDSAEDLSALLQCIYSPRYDSILYGAITQLKHSCLY
jgi:hypothetical protein